MNTYVKAVLYAYPFLQNVGEDYRVHIRNRALLSYRSTKSAEALALEIAGDILEKEKLLWLKERVDEALAKLSDVSRTLVAIRYFGKQRKIKRPSWKTEREEAQGKLNAWSERKYFRMQARLCDKLRILLIGAGLTEEVFERDFAELELFATILRFLEEGRDRRVSRAERDWLVKSV